jgi:localization factor PodJL
MPSSDRFEPRGDDRQVAGDAAAALPGAKGRRHDQGEASPPPQYFDPNEPWDAQSAEALTQLYESADGDPRKDPHGNRARRALPRQPEAAAAASPAGGSAPQDRAWLEARLAEIAEQLQTSLAALDPGKTLAPLARRIDLIEERFSEALAGVAQRADFDGLRLIEAHVMELAAHLEQTRSRLDQIGIIDDQLRGLARRLDEGDNQRLAALEGLLQDYVAEWRRSEARTTSALGALEETVARMGETVEAMEASKPATDLALSMLGAPDPDDPQVASDPLSQVYADGARALGPKCYRPPLDAADYAPRPAGEAPPPLPPPLPPAPAGEVPMPPAEAAPAQPSATGLAPPAFRASAIRARLRQAQVLTAEADAVAASEQPARPLLTAGERDPAMPRGTQRTRPGLLLAAGATLFAAAGYLLVDAFMTVPTGTSHRTGSVAPADAKAGRAEAMSLPPDATGGKQDGPAPAAPSQGRRKGMETDEAASKAPTAPKGPPAEAHGGAISANFRTQVETAAPPPASAASLHKDAPAPEDAPAPLATLPMTIGPASLRQAALNGDPAAQFVIAGRYAAGQGVAQDLAQAFQWYRRAAAKGLAPAQFRLAAMHERGLGTAADAERARIWYARAAEQGHVKAMHNLAVLSIGGGRADYAAAAKWFGQAAEHGLADSQFNLAVLYQAGLGVPKDLQHAYKWLTLAARAGDAEAAGRVAQVKAQLPAADVEAADAMVAAWRPRQPDPAVNEATTGG